MYPELRESGIVVTILAHFFRAWPSTHGLLIALARNFPIPFAIRQIRVGASRICGLPQRYRANVSSADVVMARSAANSPEPRAFDIRIWASPVPEKASHLC